MMGSISSKIGFRGRKKSMSSIKPLKGKDIDGVKSSRSLNILYDNNKSDVKAFDLPTDQNCDSTSTFSEDPGISFSCSPSEQPVCTIPENEILESSDLKRTSTTRSDDFYQNTSGRTVSVGSRTSEKLVLPALSSNDIQRFMNKKAIDEVVPHLLLRILEWSCPDKFQNENFLRYIKRKGISCRKFSPWELQKLSEKDIPENFDVTLLYNLIKMIGYNLANSKDKVWKETNEHRLESLLSEIKNIRDGITHDVKTEATSPKALEKIEIIIEKILLLASKVYSLKNEEMEAEKKILFIKMKAVKESIESITDKEKYSIQLHSKLRSECRKSLTDFCTRFCTENNMYLCKYRVSLPAVFSPVRLSFKDAESTLEAQNVHLYELLSEDSSTHSLNNMIILEGNAGLGKTAILKMLIHDFLDESTHKFENLEKFEFVYYISCREHSIPTCRDFIRETYPHLSTIVTVADLENEILRSSNLFIFDGLDELNEKSLEIVEMLMKLSARTGRSTFLFAVRPFFTRRIRLTGHFLGFRCRTFSVEKFENENEKLSFLIKYETELGRDNSEMRGLTNAFKVIGPSLKPLFSRPMTLILFCSLYGKSSKDICKWSLESEIYQELIELLKEMLDERFRSQRIINWEILIDEYIEEVCVLALKNINKNCLSLTAKDCTSFKTTSFAPESRTVLPINDCLSTTFASYTQTSGEINAENYAYQFFSEDFQEFLASKALFQRLDTQKSLKMTLEEIVQESISLKNITKFKNVFAWAMFHLLNEDIEPPRKIANYLSSFLEECGGDQFSFWSTVLSKCCYRSDIVSMAADAVGVDKWCVGPHTLPAVMHLLPVRHPKQIHVEFDIQDPIPETLGTFFELIRKLDFRGELSLGLLNSYEKMIPIDGLLEILHGSKCSVTEFTGCGSSTAISKLALLLSKRAKVTVALEHPFRHGLHLLPANTLSALEVAVQYRQTSEEFLLHSPPPNASVKLELRDVPSGAVKWALEILSALAPENHGLDELFLRRSGLTDDDLRALAAQFPDAKRARVSGERESTAKNTWTVERYHEDNTKDVRMRLGLG